MSTQLAVDTAAKIIAIIDPYVVVSTSPNVADFSAQLQSLIDDTIMGIANPSQVAGDTYAQRLSEIQTALINLAATAVPAAVQQV